MQNIYAEVEQLLQKDDGVRWTEKITTLLTDMNDVADDILALKKRINPRKQISFYVAPGDARSEHKIDLSVRLSGLEIGRVVISQEKTERLFRKISSKKFNSPNLVNLKEAWFKHFSTQKNILWESPAVAKYIAEMEDTIDVAGLKPESYVEAGFIAALNEHDGEKKLPELIHCQPILYPPTKKHTGFPFQFPVPISAGVNNKRKIPAGTTPGHIDVLGIRRRGPKYEIEVFELKKAATGKTREALRQAFAYASALHVLMSKHEKFLTEFRVMFGKPNLFPETPIRVTAVVSANESNINAYEHIKEEVASNPLPFNISAIFYDGDVKQGFKIVHSIDRPITKRREL